MMVTVVLVGVVVPRMVVLVGVVPRMMVPRMMVVVAGRPAGSALW